MDRAEATDAFTGGGEGEGEGEGGCGNGSDGLWAAARVTRRPRAPAKAGAIDSGGSGGGGCGTAVTAGWEGGLGGGVGFRHQPFNAPRPHSRQGPRERLLCVSVLS